ncbi:MAG: hypothetical protein GYB31_19700 [Bacteroidetes bacterium]|nr:hypothetical protein [Bacteroidota bacterium]
MQIPDDHAALRIAWENQSDKLLAPYIEKNQSFIPWLLPEEAVKMDDQLFLQSLYARFGEQAVQQALQLNSDYPSPLRGEGTPDWLKRTNMVGINIRTIGGYWEVIKYVATLPKHQDSIHLLPIWEPGVVSSLYGMASWQLNPEFFSESLYQLFPSIDSVEKQLKVCINFLHLMGKSVGLDVIPHTDRYSEIVLANPSHFEWLWRQGTTISNHSDTLHEEVEKSIYSFLMKNGPAVGNMGAPPPIQDFFYRASEGARLRWLFGEPIDYGGRQKRRIMLVDFLYNLGFEPVPATMGPPYRGIKVSDNPEAKTVDEAGRTWYDYEIIEPQSMSRIFGPLTRYKLYGRKNDNRDWEIDFSLPRKQVWNYVLDKFDAFCRLYPFDFMRGDMSHVQMRPEGVPQNPGDYYDLHQEIRRRIRIHRPWFGYFAESFLAPPNTMAYGDEPDHLEASDADSTLGDLQSMIVGSETFMQQFHWYLELGATRSFAPNFTIMTADKDDPRFDKFYLEGNEARYFIAQFLTDMPTYMGLGFECRDPHPLPVPNDHYTKLYVFHFTDGPKATKGPYKWGKNGRLFHRLTRLRLEGERLLPGLSEQAVQWIVRPDEQGQQKWIAWTHMPDQHYLFIANLDLKTPLIGQKIDWKTPSQVSCCFSTHRENGIEMNTGNDRVIIPDLLPGECIILQNHPS